VILISLALKVAVSFYEGRGGQRKVAHGDFGTIICYFGDLETRSPNNGADY